MTSPRGIVVVVGSFALILCQVACGQTQIAELIAPISDIGSGFGGSVATDGMHVVISAQNSAYLYDPFTRQRMAKFEVPAYPTSVAIDGTTAVVGTRSLGAFVFDFSDLSNIVKTRLLASNLTPFEYGYSVDIKGDTVIVGAMDDSSIIQKGGSAFLFDRRTGAQIAKLTANDTQASDFFGYSVAIDGDLAIVGTLNGSTLSNVPTWGAAYLFNADPSFLGTRQLAKYEAPVAQTGPHFGFNVGITGETMIARLSIGHAFLWQVGQQPTKLADSSFYESNFHSIDISEHWAAVGRPPFNRVTVYNLDGTVLNSVLVPDGQEEGFGSVVALGGNLMVVSSAKPGYVGVVRVYQLPYPVVPEPTAGAFCCIALIQYAWIRPHRPIRRGISTKKSKSG